MCIWVHSVCVHSDQMQLHELRSVQVLVASGDRCQLLHVARHTVLTTFMYSHSAAKVSSALKYASIHILLYANQQLS
jgi:hypothetical protein